MNTRNNRGMFRFCYKNFESEQLQKQKKVNEMLENSYNGWTNRDTWAANLWVTNDEYLRDYLIPKEFTGDESKISPSQLAKALQRWVRVEARSYFGIQTYKSFREDVTNLEHVNWLEIAENLIDSKKEGS